MEDNNDEKSYEEKIKEIKENYEDVPEDVQRAYYTITHPMGDMIGLEKQHPISDEDEVELDKDEVPWELEQYEPNEEEE